MACDDLTGIESRDTDKSLQTTNTSGRFRQLIPSDIDGGRCLFCQNNVDDEADPAHHNRHQDELHHHATVDSHGGLHMREKADQPRQQHTQEIIQGRASCRHGHEIEQTRGGKMAHMAVCCLNAISFAVHSPRGRLWPVQLSVRSLMSISISIDLLYSHD